MQISAVVDQVPVAEFERLAAAAEAAAVPGVDRTVLGEVIDDWCPNIDDDTDEVVGATILALGIRALIDERAARTVQVAA